MPRLPVLSAKDVIKALDQFGSKVIRQTGSHIHLWNIDKNLLVTVPNHTELAKGTLNSIMKQRELVEMSLSLLFGKNNSSYLRRVGIRLAVVHKLHEPGT